MSLCWIRCLLINPVGCDFLLLIRVVFIIGNDTEHKCDCFIPSPDPHFTWNPSLILAILSAHVFPTSNAAMSEEGAWGARAAGERRGVEQPQTGDGSSLGADLSPRDRDSRFCLHLPACLVVRTIYCSTCSRTGCSGNIWQIKFLQIWWEAGARGPAWLHVRLSLTEHDVCPSSVTKLRLESGRSVLLDVTRKWWS